MELQRKVRTVLDAWAVKFAINMSFVILISHVVLTSEIACFSPPIAFMLLLFTDRSLLMGGGMGEKLGDLNFF